MKSRIGKMSPLMGSGIVGPAGLHALGVIKRDKGSVTIHLLRMGAAPAQALLRKHWIVRRESTSKGDPGVG